TKKIYNLMDRIVKEQQQQQQAAQAARERTRTDTSTVVGNLSDMVVSSANHDVALAFGNQQRIEELEAAVLSGAQTLAGSTKKWLGLVAQLHAALKELGGVDDWARAIDADVALIVSSSSKNA
ncbi:hypothetical protein HK100_011428, partial [Physocladia obscura]